MTLVIIIRVIRMYFTSSKGLFGLRGEGGGVEGSKVELVENRLILDQFYFTLPHFPSIQTDYKSWLQVALK